MESATILIGLGANLQGKGGETPVQTLEAALNLLNEIDLEVVNKSPWYKSAPVPVSDQPWFVNGVALAASKKKPEEVLAILLEAEKTLGRKRGEKNEARIVDLDLLDYGGRVSKTGESPILPHPRMSERLFVLKPLADIAPGWKHPVSGESVAGLIAKIGDSQKVEPL